jgi:two-component system, cell cycle sensor histidine kinase and response regulator CckA
MKTLDQVTQETPLVAPGAQCALVVEDETAVRRFAVRVLQQDGFRVLEAADGVEAVELLQRRPEEVDVVVSDIVMPRMNGVELMAALSVSHPYVPVVLMSGYAKDELRELGIAAPCSIVAKPFSQERLLAEVRRCVGGRGGGSTAA